MLRPDMGHRVMDHVYHPTGDSGDRLDFARSLNGGDLRRALDVIEDGATRGVFLPFDTSLKFGLVALEASDFDNALAEFARAASLATTPKQAAMALNNEGLAYHNLGDSRAFSKLERSVSLWCTFQGANVNLVLNLERRGQHRAADLVVETWPRLFDVSKATVIRNGLMRMSGLRRIRTSSPIGELLSGSLPTRGSQCAH